MSGVSCGTKTAEASGEPHTGCNRIPENGQVPLVSPPGTGKSKLESFLIIYPSKECPFRPNRNFPLRLEFPVSDILIYNMRYFPCTFYMIIPGGGDLTAHLMSAIWNCKWITERLDWTWKFLQTLTVITKKHENRRKIQTFFSGQ